jgi:prophage tail gpP-like protein
MSFTDVARKVLAPFGVSVKEIGTPNPRPYEYLQNQKGETVWEFLESIARPRGIVLGSDLTGNFLIIGEHEGTLVSHLIEGVNILRMQCLISIDNLFGAYVEANMAQGSNDLSGTAASEQQATAPGTGPTKRKIISPAIVPVRGPDELQEMANNEARWSENTAIRANVTVAGWMRPGTNLLWRAGDDVRVSSPMAVLDQTLKAQTVTFSQDRQAGTLTTLELVNPELLGDRAKAPPGGFVFEK